MSEIAVYLFAQALMTAMKLSLPFVALVGGIGVIIAFLQAIVQIQDQNVAFGPKICAVAALLSAGGVTGLLMLQALLQQAADMLPRLAHAG